MPPSVALLTAIVQSVRQLGVPTYTPAQDMPKQLPAVRIALVNSNPTNAYKGAREYGYPFQLDVISGKNKLVEGLTLAYKVQDALRRLQVDGYGVQLVNEPSLSSVIDSSTNEILNRQIISVTYNIIEATAF